VKLSLELSKRDTGRTLYILDEPTTGLHFHDIKLLLEVLHRLRDAGNTVVVIEHNLDVIKTADWIVDLGPEGGDGGGEIVAAGTPEQVAQVETSYTGRYLGRALTLTNVRTIFTPHGTDRADHQGRADTRRHPRRGAPGRKQAGS
jgi:excinuclease ABC subunit A